MTTKEVWIKRKEKFGQTGCSNEKARKEKISLGLINSYKLGKRIPVWINKKRPEITKLKMSSSHKLRHKIKGGHSQETIEKIRQSKLGSRNSSEKLSNILKELWNDKEYRELQLDSIFNGNRISKPNKPEQLLINLIKENNLNFDYVGNGKFWIKGKNYNFNPDFVHKDKKIIIELFGDYWHNREDLIERDRERVETYTNCGYRLLIVWEHELIDINKVLNEIKHLILD